MREGGGEGDGVIKGTEREGWWWERGSQTERGRGKEKDEDPESEGERRSNDGKEFQLFQFAGKLLFACFVPPAGPSGLACWSCPCVVGAAGRSAEERGSASRRRRRHGRLRVRVAVRGTSKRR